MTAVTYDEALTKFVGEFGKGQLLCVSCTSLFYIPNVVVFYLLVFITVDPIANKVWECTDPADAACSSVWQASPVPPQDFCALSQSQWRWTNQDNLAARFNMVCSDKWKVQLLNACMFIGCLIGAAWFGHLNDTYGRKKPLLLATIMCIVSVFATVAAPTYWFMAITRAITGIGAAGQNQSVALLNAEIAGRSRRGLASILSGTFWPMGEFVLVGIAMAVPNWRHLTAIAGGMLFVQLLLYPIIPESARWLLSQGRAEEATAVVQRLARWNGAKMPPGSLVAVQPVAQPHIPEQDDTTSSNAASMTDHQLVVDVAITSVPTGLKGEGKQVISDAATTTTISAAAAAADGCILPITNAPAGVAASAAAAAAATGGSSATVKRMGLMTAMHQRKLLIRTLLLIIVWFALYIVSYGVNLGAGALPGSLYMTFSLLTVAELSAQLMTALVADKAGRHNILSFGLVVSGAACLACAGISNNTAKAVFAVFGKYGCTIGMAVLGTFTTELFATPIRASAMGIFNEAGRLGSIIAPLMLMAGAQVKPENPVFVPFLAFGVAALLAGVLTLVLPETLGAAMPENIEDMDQLLSLFSAKPWRQGPVATVSFVFRARAVRAARAAHGQPEHQQQRQQSSKQQQKQSGPQKNDTSNLPHICVDCSGLHEGEGEGVVVLESKDVGQACNSRV